MRSRSFHAERHTDASNFKLTLTGFAPTYSTCGPTCGDGIVAGTERCDLGRDMNTGGYNGCTADCKPGPFCGDSIVQPDHEQCDDGINITIYSMNGMPGCAPGCVPSSFCGDGKVDGLFGEQCDRGARHEHGRIRRVHGHLPARPSLRRRRGAEGQGRAMRRREHRRRRRLHLRLPQRDRAVAGQGLI